ncbi:hypothetical protein [Flavobacterium sharifuzzamanii]|uniref:hypothetical protein n=1 Tax=Flavobacterium sharifuzzamanii TaxID=2211133 RepID=UPI000DABA01F|nr:hypothetical protein [Flavobacterium sharifuzzamanii]KAF2082005.1 hypothetical protein DMA14_05920 [Flavobacterium sharifuzzamanii]
MKIKDEIPNIFQLRENFIEKSFWFLYWIDGIYIRDEVKYADFHFINKNSPDDNFHEFQNSKRVIISLKFSLVCFFSIGCVFDEYGRLIHFPEGDNYNSDVITLSENYSLIKEKANIKELVDNIFYPLPSLRLTNEICYFVANVKIKKDWIKVIIPILSVCSYLYFKSEIITELIVSNDLLYFISFHELEKDNKKIGYVEYDNSKILNNEVRSIVPFFFLKDSLGMKSLDLISNNILLGLIQNRMEETDKLIYLNTIMPFSNMVDFELKGKMITINNKKYFFSYAVKNIIIKDDDLFKVDKVMLVPKYNKVKYWENAIKNFRERTKRERRKLNEGYKKLQYVKDYNGIYFPSDFCLKNLPSSFGLYIETQMSDDELIEIHHNLYQNNSRGIALNSNYMNLIYESLINDIRFQKINFIAIDDVIFKRKQTIIFVNELEFNVWVIEIKYKDFYFYLIDFLREHIGVVSSIRGYSRITPLTMKVFLHKIIYNYLRYPNFYMWFKIKQDRSTFIKDFEIDILDSQDYNPLDFYSSDNKAFEKISDIEQKLGIFISKAV